MLNCVGQIPVHHLPKDQLVSDEIVKQEVQTSRQNLEVRQALANAQQATPS